MIAKMGFIFWLIVWGIKRATLTGRGYCADPVPTRNNSLPLYQLLIKLYHYKFPPVYLFTTLNHPIKKLLWFLAEDGFCYQAVC